MNTTKNKELDIEDIRALLAHRYPMLLIDRVIDYVPMKNINIIKNVSINEPQLQGHFPSKAIYPGVMIIEGMAQATGLLSALSMEIDNQKLFYLVAVDDCRFRKTVVPGDTMHITVEAIGLPRRNMWRFNCTAFVADKLVASAKLMCASH